MRGKRRLGYELVVIAIIILTVVIALVLFFGRECRSAFSVAGDAMTGSSRQAECHAAGEKAQTSAKNWGESQREVPNWSETDSAMITNEMRWPRGRSRHEKSFESKTELE